MIGPLSRKDKARFIFFKPGYKSITYIKEIKIPDEKYFAIEKDMIGEEREIKYIDPWDTLITYKGPMGVVRLEKAKTDKERRDASPSSPTNYHSDKLPLLYKAINEDRRNRGLEGEEK